MRISTFKSLKSIRSIVEDINLVSCGETGSSGTLHSLDSGILPTTFVACKVDGAFAGWCAHFENGQTHVFVHPCYRRIGIGSRLLAAVVKKNKINYVCPWSTESLAFFKKNCFRLSIPGLEWCEKALADRMVPA